MHCCMCILRLHWNRIWSNKRKVTTLTWWDLMIFPINKHGCHDCQNRPLLAKKFFLAHMTSQSTASSSGTWNMSQQTISAHRICTMQFTRAPASIFKLCIVIIQETISQETSVQTLHSCAQWTSKKRGMDPWMLTSISDVMVTDEHWWPIWKTHSEINLWHLLSLLGASLWWPCLPQNKKKDKSNFHM